jgi:hypothetical protein
MRPIAVQMTVAFCLPEARQNEHRTVATNSDATSPKVVTASVNDAFVHDDVNDGKSKYGI